MVIAEVTETRGAGGATGAAVTIQRDAVVPVQWSQHVRPLRLWTSPGKMWQK